MFIALACSELPPPVPLPLADVRTDLGDGACRRPGLRANPSRRWGRAEQARRSARSPRQRPRTYTKSGSLAGRFWCVWPHLPPRTGRCGSPLHPRRRRAVRTGAPRLPSWPARGAFLAHQDGFAVTTSCLLVGPGRRRR